MLTQCHINLLGDLEQMACGMFHLMQFSCSQIDIACAKSRRAVLVRCVDRSSQGIVQFKECNVFLPTSLV